MHRRLSVLKQWSKERFGATRTTQTNDDFKEMESEMRLRQNGLNKLHAATKTYVRWLSKKYPNERKTKDFPVTLFGAAMLQHADDFDDNVEFGQCLRSLGEVQERLGRMQEAHLANVISCWEESLESSLMQMTEYNNARKLLNSKRLAYDAARNQLEKSKRDDPRLEAAVIHCRKQFADVYKENVRLMREITAGEEETIVDLTSLVATQISYHERCRAALLSLKNDWPASGRLIEQSASQVGADHVYRSARSMASTSNLQYHRESGSESEESEDTNG